MDFGRIAAQSAKQVIMQKVREAERLRQYEEFKDRVGQIINGLVKRTEYGNVIVDVGRGEAILRRDQLIQREAYRNGDRIRALIRDVRHEARGPQIFLSRTAPEFLAELFKMEVPEIYDGIIEIKAVARDPGSRAKMGVISYDSSIDPVGACVGMRGSRVQAVVNELQGEKIDIIPWSADAGDVPRERAAARRGLEGRLRRGQRPDRGGGARRAAQPRDRAAGAERAPRRASSPASTSTSSPTSRRSERRQAEFAEERTRLFMDSARTSTRSSRSFSSSEGFILAGGGGLCRHRRADLVIDGFDETNGGGAAGARPRLASRSINQKAHRAGARAGGGGEPH
jgi:transcription termination/antitermination protein NusA